MKQARTRKGKCEAAKKARTSSRRAPELPAEPPELPAEPPPKRPVGHPPLYTPELAAEICRRIAGGQTIKAICEDDGMPARSSVYEWIADDKEGFAGQCRRARTAQSYAWADDSIDIADDTSRDTKTTERGEVPDTEWIARSRLRWEVRKHLMGKFNPAVFGDKIEHAGPNGTPLFSCIERVIIKSTA